jgi:N-acetylglucosaminyldiphosphoundecaprenol N-acetyl-beta-D-mannosaminyltransferase
MKNRNKRMMCTDINPWSYYLAHHRPDLVENLHRCDIVFSDGFLITFALRLLYKVDACRIGFDATSLYHPILSMLNQDERAVFIIGGKPGVVSIAVQHMRRHYPKIRFVGSLDGYGGVASSVNRIIQSGADFVLCGMGCGHQENFLRALADSEFHGAAFTCGGFLDQLNERPDGYYPGWINQFELRSLYHLRKEPARLWKRYCVEYWTFFFLLLREYVRLRLVPSERSPQWLEARPGPEAQV